MKFEILLHPNDNPEMICFHLIENYLPPMKFDNLGHTDALGCGHRYEMDALAFEKFQNTIFFKIFKFTFKE